MLALLVASLLAGQEVLLDRTLAVVGGQVITLADVRVARALGLVEEADTADDDALTERLIDRALVLREVQRYAPPEPAADAVDARLRETQGRFAAEAAYREALAAGGFTDERLRTWFRNDLRIAAYLDQRFAAAGTPTEAEVAAYYAARRAEYERDGQSYEAAAPRIRERLAADRRRDLIADWIADLRRRTEIIRLAGPGA
ncbi:MAG: hypothetical protein AB1635_12430 [Acidobacteriota bacterium]